MKIEHIQATAAVFCILIFFNKKKTNERNKSTSQSNLNFSTIVCIFVLIYVSMYVLIFRLWVFFVLLNQFNYWGVMIIIIPMGFLIHTQSGDLLWRWTDRVFINNVSCEIWNRYLNEIKFQWNPRNRFSRLNENH